MIWGGTGLAWKATMWMLWNTSVMAAGFAGMGVPVAGGGLANTAEVGAAAMVVNPAAAGLPYTEFSLDIGQIRTTVSAQLEGEEAVTGQSADWIPTAAVTTPISRASLGLALFVPFARSGSNPEDSANRFHSIDGSLLAAEANVVLAGEVADGVVVGLAGRLAYLSLESHKAVDTGTLIAGISAQEMDLAGHEFLEGSQTLSNTQGLGAGLALGMQVELPQNWTMAMHYRSPLWGEVHHRLAFTPSQDLTVQIQADMVSNVTLPAQAGLAVGVPVGRTHILPEVGFEGWNVWRRFESVPDNVAVGSADPILDEILASAGLSAEDLVSNPEVTINGTRNIVWGGVGLRHKIDADWTVRGGVWWVPSAIPDRRVHPANVDYASLDFRFGLQRRAVALSGDVFVIPSREITQSAWGGDTGSAAATPPGMGTYTLRGARVGMTLTPRLRHRSPNGSAMSHSEHRADHFSTRARAVAGGQGEQ